MPTVAVCVVWHVVVAATTASCQSGVECERSFVMRKANAMTTTVTATTGEMCANTARKNKTRVPFSAAEVV